MRGSDDLATTKEMRRNQLALRFLRHGTRTRTIREWTFLSGGRIDNIRLAHVDEFPAVKLRRPSGRRPMTLCELTRRPEMRAEAAVLGGLCRIFKVIPRQPMPDAKRYLPSIPRGDHALDILEEYRALVPSGTITADELICLMYSLAEGEQHDIDWCSRCDCAILIDPYGSARRICMHCAPRNKNPRRSRKRPPKELPDESEVAADHSPPGHGEPGGELPGFRRDQFQNTRDGTDGY